jgi:hypothetical protein
MSLLVGGHLRQLPTLLLCLGSQDRTLTAACLVEQLRQGPHIKHSFKVILLSRVPQPLLSNGCFYGSRVLPLIKHVAIYTCVCVSVCVSVPTERK